MQGDEIDVIARKIDQAPVELRVPRSAPHSRRSARSTDEIIRILKHLGFELIPEPGEEDEFTVHIPSWRLDIEREIDLIEEIARLHGYDKFANTLPPIPAKFVELPDAAKDEKLRSALLALGYNEAISLTFISHEEAEQFSYVAGARAGKSAQRRSLGHAHVDGSRHAEHAGLQPESRQRQCAAV